MLGEERQRGKGARDSRGSSLVSGQMGAHVAFARVLSLSLSYVLMFCPIPL